MHTNKLEIFFSSRSLMEEFKSWFCCSGEQWFMAFSEEHSALEEDQYVDIDRSGHPDSMVISVKKEQ